MLEQDRAIVTDIPGTTRDLVSEIAAIQGIPVKFVDTAGIRAGQDLVETLGIERSYQAMADADVTLVVLDLAQPVQADDLALIERARSQGRYILVGNKSDLPRVAEPPEEIARRFRAHRRGNGPTARAESRRPPRCEQESGFITSIRHEQLLRESLEALRQARKAAEFGIPHEMLLLDLYAALAAHRCHHRRYHSRRHPEPDLLYVLHWKIALLCLQSAAANRLQLEETWFACSHSPFCSPLRSLRRSRVDNRLKTNWTAARRCSRCLPPSMPPATTPTWTPTPTRPSASQVREALAQKHLESVEALKKFFAKHRKDDPEAELSQYISFALSIDGPPDFKYWWTPEEIPPDVQKLDGLNELIASFYQEAGIQSLWNRAQPEFDRAIASYHSGVAQALLEANAYLRNPTSGFRGRYFQIYIDLLGAPNQVQTRSYKDEYFVVVTPSAEPQIDQIRHAYLHYLLDPLSLRYNEQLERVKALADFAQPAPALRRRLQERFPAARHRVRDQSGGEQARSAREPAGPGQPGAW